MRRRPLRGRGRIRLRSELPLLQLPAGDRFGIQALAGIARDKLSIRHGEDNLSLFGDEGSADDVHCETCGSLLFSIVRDGVYVHVAMGTLVDDPTIRPTAHIFVGSKAPWFTIADGLPQYEAHVPANGPSGGSQG